jgi:hypothetical protein
MQPLTKIGPGFAEALPSLSAARDKAAHSYRVVMETLIEVLSHAEEISVGHIGAGKPVRRL